MLTFKQYVLRHPESNDQIGDFVGDVKYDKTFPAGRTTWQELRRYLRRKGAYTEAISAARTLWNRYSKEISSAPT